MNLVVDKPCLGTPLCGLNMCEMTSEIEIDHKNRTFNVKINMPGFQSEEIVATINKNKININAINKNNINSFTYRKTIGVNINLSTNLSVEHLDRSYRGGALYLVGTLVDNNDSQILISETGANLN